MIKLLTGALRLFTRGLGLLGLAVLLALLGALVSGDGRLAARLFVAFVVLAFAGGLTLLLARGAAWATRRVVVVAIRRGVPMPLGYARRGIAAGALLALLFAYLTLFAASDALPALLVFLGGLLWLLAGAERRRGRARALVTAAERAWKRPAAAYVLAARLLTAGVLGNALLLVLWLA